MKGFYYKHLIIDIGKKTFLLKDLDKDLERTANHIKNNVRRYNLIV